MKHTTTHSLKRRSFLIGGIVVLALSVFATQHAEAMITTQLDLGSTGSDVTELQTYLRANPSLYPSGMVTGYFGRLTEGGVQRFQSTNGIVSSGTPSTTGYGRVGPTTMSRLNSAMSGAGSVSPGGIFGQSAISPLGEPLASNVSIQYGTTTATFAWMTNESAQGQVYYGTSPLSSTEDAGIGQLGYIGGSYSFDGGNRTTHSIAIQGLQPNTTYYYIVRSVDASNNSVVTMPATFRTNQ